MTDSPFSGGSGHDVSEVSVGSDQHRSVKTISPAEQEKLDERARKLAARKVRNRLSAEASRKRVRDEMEQLSARCEFLQDQVSALQDKLSKYEDVGDVDVAKRKRKDNSGGGLRELNSYIEPAAFIEQPCTYRMALFAGV
jgi:chromosome segregation ATPase